MGLMKHYYYNDEYAVSEGKSPGFVYSDSTFYPSLEKEIQFLDSFDFKDWMYHKKIEIFDDNTNLILWRRTFYKLTD